MLRRSTTSSVACEHKNRSLVNTRIPRYSLAVSPWHGSLAIRCTLAVSPWEYSIAIGCLAVRRHSHSPLACYRRVLLPAGRLLYHCTIAPSPYGDPPRELWGCSCPLAKPNQAKVLTCRGTLAYIALSHFSNVRDSSRQRYPSLFLEHTKRLWWSRTLNVLSLSRTETVPLTGIAGAVASEASQVAYH